MKEGAVSFDVFLHFGTMISIVIFFRKDILNMFVKGRNMLKFILIACVPTFIIGMLFEDVIEELFTNVKLIGASLVATGAFLLFASYFAAYHKRAHKTNPVGVVNSAIIGIAQGISVIPGVSRSGSTIGTALIAGLGEDMSLRFSFLLALPAILGANLLKARHIYGNLVSIETVPYIAGFIAAMITGIVAIKLLFGILRKNLFYLFGVYCLLAGAAVVVLAR
jgi:undecaprenyl-diphosphatase